MHGRISELLDELLAEVRKIAPRELSNRQLGLIEGKANSTVSGLRSLRNLTSPVQLIPIEVLAMIFSYVLEFQSPQSYLPDSYLMCPFMPEIRSLYRVCRKWHTATLAFPALWAKIYRSEGPLSMLSLGRSGQDAMIDVYSDESLHLDPSHWYFTAPPSPPGDHPQLPSQNEGGSVALLNELTPKAHRIRQLHLLNAYESALGELVIMTTPMPNLESLSLSMQSHVFRPWGVLASWRPRKLFDGCTPQLRRLTLKNFPTSLPDHSFSGLTHLCLSENRHARPLHTISQFLGILRASPHLEVLDLVNFFLDDDDPSTQFEKIPLPNLRSLCLNNLISNVKLPDLIILYHPITYFQWGNGYRPDETLAEIFPLYDTQCETLKELRFTSACPKDSSYIPLSPSLWRDYYLHAIISTPDKFQIDGRIQPHMFLLDTPAMFNLGGVQELWLSTVYATDPSHVEWKTFFSSLPSLTILVISRRSAHGIISALSLPKGHVDCAHLFCPTLHTLRLSEDPLLSILQLAILAEQRDRFKKRLKLIDIIKEPSPCSPGASPALIPTPLQSEAFMSDLSLLEEYVDKVDFTQTCTADWDIIPEWPPKVYGW